MKQQILAIHGGTTHSTYEKYINYLSTKSVNVEKLTYHTYWKDMLGSDLGDDYEVLSPRMPNSTNSKYREWSLWFGRIIPILKNDVILIGHSLGGIFLAKYLSENILPVRIKSTILVAAPFRDTEFEELASFKLTKSLDKFNKQSKKILLIQSKDDEVVPLADVYEYHKRLTNSETIIFETNGHFLQSDFPEMINLLRNL